MYDKISDPDIFSFLISNLKKNYHIFFNLNFRIFTSKFSLLKCWFLNLKFNITFFSHFANYNSTVHEKGKLFLLMHV